MVGWGGCECDGLVSNTLSLSMSATSTHPPMVSHSPVCFKAVVMSFFLMFEKKHGRVLFVSGLKE